MTRFRPNPRMTHTELTSLIGEANLDTYQDREHLYLKTRRRLITHATARRAYICPCGSPLVTQYDPEMAQPWVTRCGANPEHPQTGFLYQTTYYVQVAKSQAEAAEVLANLPPEVRQAIKKRGVKNA